MGWSAASAASVLALTLSGSSVQPGPDGVPVTVTPDTSMAPLVGGVVGALVGAVLALLVAGLLACKLGRRAGTSSRSQRGSA